MKRIESKSDRRLIIEVLMSGKKANMLVDTGAAVGLVDKNQAKKYSLSIGNDYKGTLVGAGGAMKNIKYCNTMADFEGKIIPQFLIADISDVVKSVKKETGIEILGIVSLPQCRMAHIGIDCDDMDIIIE